MVDKEEYERVNNPVEIARLLDVLGGAQGATLVMEETGTPFPVLIQALEHGDSLTLNLDAVREVVPLLARGESFRLTGHSEGKLTRTPPLGGLIAANDDKGCWRCDYPLHLERLQRRASFRARLRLGMVAAAEVSVGDSEGEGDSEDEPLQGDLLDLSVDGCQLVLPQPAARLLRATQLPLNLTLCFPDGTRLAMKGSPQHYRIEQERRVVRSGFHFSHPSADQQRELWRLVTEIERESARIGEGLESRRPPSTLFQFASEAGQANLGRRQSDPYPTPMTARLALVAGYLDAQALELVHGGHIDGAQLSQQTDRLLALLEEDREAVLFALRCLTRESWPVRHGLAVAVRLVDLAGVKLPRDLLKAMAASAMIHDLGKVLLPESLALVPTFGEAERRQLASHVDLLRQRMRGCRWLADSVFEAVACQLNERLDGSGYPNALDADALRELARASAVVDAIDAMRHQRIDRAAWRIEAIYRYLVDHPEKFDSAWVKRYIQRFGLYPVGSLVRFEGGDLGWVLGLNDQGQPNRICLHTSQTPPTEMPRSPLTGAILTGSQLTDLGRPSGEIAVGA